MGLGLGSGGLKDMKVLIGQRGNAEGERLWNGQAFLHFDCFCASANQKTGKERERRQNAEMLSSFPKTPLENFLSMLKQQEQAVTFWTEQCTNFLGG